MELFRFYHDMAGNTYSCSINVPPDVLFMADQDGEFVLHLALSLLYNPLCDVEVHYLPAAFAELLPFHMTLAGRHPSNSSSIDTESRLRCCMIIVTRLVLYVGSDFSTSRLRLPLLRQVPQLLLQHFNFCYTRLISSVPTLQIFRTRIAHITHHSSPS